LYERCELSSWKLNKFDKTAFVHRDECARTAWHTIYNASLRIERTQLLHIDLLGMRKARYTRRSPIDAGQRTTVLHVKDKAVAFITIGEDVIPGCRNRVQEYPAKKLLHEPRSSYMHTEEGHTHRNEQIEKD